MTKYRLPEALGGGEWEATTDMPGATMVWFKVPGGGSLEIRRDALVVVPGPALPPEPPVGSIVLIGADAGHPDSGSVFRRYTYGWCAPGWDGEECVAWAAVCEAGRSDGDSPVLLVPDPFAEPVVLPYRRYDQDTDEYVAVTVVDGRVLFGVALASTLVSKIPPAYVTVEDALAVLAAHRQLATP